MARPSVFRRVARLLLSGQAARPLPQADQEFNGITMRKVKRRSIVRCVALQFSNASIFIVGPDVAASDMVSSLGQLGVGL